MKRFEDYTREELNALTGEQVLKIIDIECAFAGKPFVPDMPLMPDVPVFKPDKIAYECAGYAFENIEDAQKLCTTIIELNPKRKESNYYENTTTHTLKDMDSYNCPKVEKLEVYSKEYLTSISEQKKKSDAAMKEYKARLNEYEATIKERSNISKEVWEAVNEAQAYFYNQNKRVSEFKRYFDLAESNTEIAWNFMTAAYPDIEEDFENIKAICLASIEGKDKSGD